MNQAGAPLTSSGAVRGSTTGPRGTVIVRSILVTALNPDVGRWMWWPGKLARTPDPAATELSHERAEALAGR